MIEQEGLPGPGLATVLLLVTFGAFSSVLVSYSLFFFLSFFFPETMACGSSPAWNQTHTTLATCTTAAAMLGP